MNAKTECSKVYEPCDGGEKAFSEYEKCMLCRRACGVDRSAGNLGFCRSDGNLRVARAALHFWEEPPISGTKGSGAIFFSGCSLSCVFCQNRVISRGQSGKIISVERLAEIMLELEEKGAHNINLVTATHYVPSVREAIKIAKRRGLSVPIVYNTGSYDTVETIKSLEGLVDIYLPDFKYYRSATAERYSAARDYPEAAISAIDEMLRQRGAPCFKDGLMLSGVIIRILELPNHSAEAKLSLSSLFKRYGDRVYFSLMNQYTPPSDASYPINRPVSREEYNALLDYAVRLGVKFAYTQDFGAVGEKFIPPFDNTGV